MAVKYHCPKCEKKFVDWGAEKLNYKCPDCKREALVPVGSETEATQAKKPSKLKRRPALAVARETNAEEVLDTIDENDNAPAAVSDDADDEDIESIDEDEISDDDEAIEEEIEEDEL